MAIETVCVTPGILPPTISTIPNSPSVCAKLNTNAVSTPFLASGRRIVLKRRRQDQWHGDNRLYQKLPAAGREGDPVAERQGDQQKQYRNAGCQPETQHDRCPVQHHRSRPLSMDSNPYCFIRAAIAGVLMNSRNLCAVAFLCDDFRITAACTIRG